MADIKQAVETPLPGTPSNETTTPKVDVEQDPTNYLKTKFKSLVYWETPKKSATFLLGALGVLNLTQYYSVLQIIVGLFTLATGLNLVYVNLHKQSQRIISNKAPHELVNPHSHRTSPTLPRERILRSAQVTMDVVEVVTNHVTKLVLIQDNLHSLVAVITSFFIWTLAKYFSTQTLLTLFLVLAFSLPRLYLQNQAVIDAHVEKYSKQARILIEQYGCIASQKARDIIGQIKGSTKKSPEDAKKD